MLKVLYISAPTGLAGAERVILNYLQHYDRDAISVHVVSYVNHQRMDNPFTSAVEKIGVPFERIAIGNTSLFWQISRTLSVIRCNSIDIVHTHGYRSDIKGLFAARIAGVPVISTVHGWTPVSWKLRVYEGMDRLFLKHFDSVICVSDGLVEQCKQFGISGNRLVRLANAVNVPEAKTEGRTNARKKLGLLPQDKMVLTVGRLSPEKGLPLLLQAFAQKISAHDRIYLYMVGEGSMRDELCQLSERLGIGDRIVMTGFTEDVDVYYAAADVFAMSSFTEGFPMALLEAMTWRLPVVATSVGGVPEVIQDGVSGRLVVPGSPEALAEAMDALLTDPRQAEALAKQGHETVKQLYSVKTWARELETVYRATCTTRRRL